MRPPNLLVLLSDQHNPHVLGCAGDPVVRTPHLDALATRGVRFTTTYCASPLCVPSRMSFLTGQLPSSIGVWSNGGVLASDVPTFAHALGAAGYETVLCGRMHFVGPDQRHGFEQRLVGDVTGSPLGGPGPDLGHIPLATAGMGHLSVEIAGPGRTSYQAFDEAVTAAAVDYLHQRGASGDRPFCLVVGFVLPHPPYICPGPLFDAYYPVVDVPALPPDYLDTLHPAMRLWRDRRGVDGVTEEQRRVARAAYYGLVTLTDANVGRILEALDVSGLRENTAVAYLSDHGDMAGELGMWWKMSFYEGSAGVPMLWSWPGRFGEGRTVPAITNLLDVGPTLLELAGAPALPDAAGRSLAGWLTTGEVADWCEATLSELPPDQGVPAARMLRRGPWKLTYYEGCARPQLFHLPDDPGELDDRGGDPAIQALRDDLLMQVRAGWSGAAIEAALARQAPNRRLFAAWYRAVQPPDPDRWPAPPGANVFPDRAAAE